MATEAPRLLATILSASDDAIVVTQPDGTVTSWSAGAERIYGYSADEIVGKPIDLLVPAHRAAERLTILGELFATGLAATRRETERMTKDGSLVPVALTVAPIEDEDGELIGLCSISSELTERKGLEAQIAYLGRNDRLTGLYSRREFEYRLRRQIPYGRRYGAGCTVMLLGLDGLDLVNVSRGRAAGDQVLVHVARLLTDRLRTTDTIARLDGDRFALLLPEATEDNALNVAEALLDRVRTNPAHLDAPAYMDGLDRGITCSIGIVCFDNGRDLSAEELIAAAESALREAKRQGRDRAVVHARSRSIQNT